MKKTRFCIIFFILFFLAAAPAFGAKATGINVHGLDGLFVATSGHTIEAQRFVLTGGFAYGSDDDYSTHAVPIMLTYGMMDNIEAGLSVPVNTGVDPDGPGSESGFGDVGISAKYGFLAEGTSVPGLAAGVRLKIPSANDNKGLGTGDFDVGFLFAASKIIGQAEYMLNVEYVLVGGENPNTGQDLHNEVNYAVGARYNYTETMSVTLELIDQNFVLNNRFGGDHLVVGGEFEPTPGLMIGVNLGIAMTGGPVTDFIFAAEVGYTF